ncbi:hypothetical protein Nepgr_027816 [Nepenthes gracilis]|uniref:Uncharacterized protein n=1 Tax=Nepenthes gracilis TaxID=150966 RepID=A0AAD3TB79_NEPGR|nr:hypothetical protein Nepgr_027816 [Nepenthes gracilis]
MANKVRDVTPGLLEGSSSSSRSEPPTKESCWDERRLRDHNELGPATVVAEGCHSEPSIMGLARPLREPPGFESKGASNSSQHRGPEGANYPFCHVQQEVEEIEARV